MKFRYDIQGLRAVAVAAVFVFHLFPQTFTGGFIGVDVFFVISGFLISSIISKQKQQHSFSFYDFYLGRFTRLTPIYYIVLTTIMLIGSLVFFNRDLLVLKTNLFFASLFYSNVELAKANDYFGQLALENPLLHTWTLSLEMQFYLLLPLLIILVARRYLFRVGLLIVVVLLGYSIYSGYFIGQQDQIYFSLWARIPEFLIGMLFALQAHVFKGLSGFLTGVLSWGSLLGLGACVLLFNDVMVFPGFWVLLPCLFTGILLVVESKSVSNLLSNKVMVHIGMLSYSIYLWHWPIMAFIRYYYQKVNFSVYQVVFICVLTYALSWASFYFVEQNSRKLKIVPFVGYTSLIGVVLLVTFFSAQYINTGNLKVPAMISSTPFGDRSHGVKFQEVQLLGGAEQSLGEVCLIGDSHAKSYRKFFDVVGQEHNFSIKAVSFNALPIIGGFDRSDFTLDGNYQKYKRVLPFAQRLVEQSDIILFSSIFNGNYGSIQEEFRFFVQALKPHQKLVILQDYPVGKTNYLKKYRSFVRPDLPLVESDLKQEELPEYVVEIIDQDPQVFLLSIDYTNNTLPYINDTLGYYDPSHLNDYGSAQLGQLHSQSVYEQLKAIQDYKIQ